MSRWPSPIAFPCERIEEVDEILQAHPYNYCTIPWEAVFLAARAHADYGERGGHRVGKGRPCCSLHAPWPVCDSAEPDPIPQVVQGWFDEAKAAYGRGAYAEALQLQEKVLGWVKANLASRHPFQAKALNNLADLNTQRGQLEAAVPLDARQ